MFESSSTRSGRLHPTSVVSWETFDTREGRLLYGRRLGIVEPVFGNLHTHRLRRFTPRSRRKIDAQRQLYCIVHILQKLQGKAA